MRTLLSRAIQIDPSFHVALGLIVILGVVEIFFGTSYYVGLARANRVSPQAIANTIARPPAASPASAYSPAPPVAKPTVPQTAAVASPAPSIVEQLLAVTATARSWVSLKSRLLRRPTRKRKQT